MTVTAQFLSLLVMIASGIVGAACIDLVRTIKYYAPPRSFRRKGYITLELTTWLLLGIASFYLLFKVRAGEWRIVDPIAQLAGFYCYQLYFQSLFRFGGRLIYSIFLRPLWLIFNFFISIIRWIIRALMRVVRLLLLPFRPLVKKTKQLRLKKTR
ncbi:spore cortex biosynthesis protein YabQ [Viridibacillus sp. NPDC096237]|uniref:spore cortex biosynthesis protein YabQ n=1 Tax=Viridibacillus sp. NPDC096237 TaxID=3390721 RepID=UPI003D06E46F